MFTFAKFVFILTLHEENSRFSVRNKFNHLSELAMNDRREKGTFFCVFCNAKIVLELNHISDFSTVTLN